MPDRFWHVGINVTDMDRSIEFYEKVGFKIVSSGIVENPATGRAFQIPGGRRLRFAHMRLNNVEAESMLDLIQWLEPPTTGRAEPSMLESGLHRFSILTDDIDGRYETLSAQGVEFTQPPTTVMAPDGTRGWRLLFAKDPDGTVFHFVQFVGDHSAH